jgi:hypothetical protein
MLYASTPCSKVSGGSVVASGRFASLIAPTSALSAGISEADAASRFGVYPHLRHAPSLGVLVVDADPWFDADAGAVYVTTSSTRTGDALNAAWAAAGAAAKRRIEMAAEAERMKYLTAGSGKALTYEAKRAEAERHAADQDPQAANYPFAAAEATVRNTTIAAVIAIWNVNIALWAVNLGPAIEAAEQKAKLDVDAAVAAKDASALAAAESVIWPSPS